MDGGFWLAIFLLNLQRVPSFNIIGHGYKILRFPNDGGGRIRLELSQIRSGGVKRLGPTILGFILEINTPWLVETLSPNPQPWIYHWASNIFALIIHFLGLISFNKQLIWNSLVKSNIELFFNLLEALLLRVSRILIFERRFSLEALSLSVQLERVEIRVCVVVWLV